MGWGVVVTKPQAEELAAKSLVSGGWRVYLPRYRRVLRGHRLGQDGRRKRVRGGGEVVLRPLFPRYLFVEDGIGWGGIGWVRGVERLVGMGRGPSGGPELMGDGLFEGIRAAADGGVFDEGALGAREDLVIGGQVRIAELDDRVGMLVGLDEAGRAEVMLGMLGRDVRVRVSADGLVGVR